jgi:hypothetical protein
VGVGLLDLHAATDTNVRSIIDKIIAIAKLVSERGEEVMWWEWSEVLK